MSVSTTRLQPTFGEVQKCSEVALYFFWYGSCLSSCSCLHTSLWRRSAEANLPQSSSETQPMDNRSFNWQACDLLCRMAMLKQHFSEWLDCCYLTKKKRELIIFLLQAKLQKCHSCTLGEATLCILQATINPRICMCFHLKTPRRYTPPKKS